VLSSRGKLRATVAETRADVVVLALGILGFRKTAGDCCAHIRGYASSG